ncbi:hypothetical protein BaRGS_00027968 [Batillaria attramentaria]|uniref:Uncharacterized protein n=1 Tax=Batillaria attramentaria TaxID=370345 RepID=A0ABD0K0F7_9CAEN
MSIICFAKPTPGQIITLSFARRVTPHNQAPSLSRSDKMAAGFDVVNDQRDRPPIKTRAFSNGPLNKGRQTLLEGGNSYFARDDRADRDRSRWQVDVEVMTVSRGLYDGDFSLLGLMLSSLNLAGLRRRMTRHDVTLGLAVKAGI